MVLLDPKQGTMSATPDGVVFGKLGQDVHSRWPRIRHHSTAAKRPARWRGPARSSHLLVVCVGLRYVPAATQASTNAVKTLQGGHAGGVLPTCYSGRPGVGRRRSTAVDAEAHPTHRSAEIRRASKLVMRVQLLLLLSTAHW